MAIWPSNWKRIVSPKRKAGHFCSGQLRDKSSFSAANKDAPRGVAQRAGGISCQCHWHCQRHIIVVLIRIRIQIIRIRVLTRFRIRIRIWIRISIKVLLLNRWKSVLCPGPYKFLQWMNQLYEHRGHMRLALRSPTAILHTSGTGKKTITI